MKENTLLRWLAVLPVSIGGMLVGVLISAILNVLPKLLYGDWSGYMFSTYVLTPAFGAVLGTYWGARMVYKKRATASVIAGFIIGGIYVFDTFFHVALGGTEVWGYTIKAVCAMLGSGFVIYNFWKKGDEYALF